MRSGERHRRRNKSFVASLWRDICRITCGLTFSSLSRFRVAVEGRDFFPEYILPEFSKVLVDLELTGLEEEAVRGRFHCEFVCTIRDGVVSPNPDRLGERGRCSDLEKLNDGDRRSLDC